MIEQISNFLSKKDCKNIIEMIDSSHSRSSVAGSGKERSTYGETRTSSTSNLNDNNPTIKRIKKRIAKKLGLNINQGEPLQGQLYKPGEYFKPHQDWFHGDSYKNHCLSSGNRIYTFMVYLNIPEEGGETNFPNLNLEVKAEIGKALLWSNVKDDQPNSDVLHEGVEIKKGKKYIITSWWRENEWNGNEDDRLAKEYWEKNPPLNTTTPTNTFSSKENIPKLTTHGFEVVKTPTAIWGLINDAYQLLQNSIKTEDFQGVKDVIKTSNGEYGSEMMSFDNLTTIRDLLHQSFLPIHEEWSGQKLEPSSLYGIRSYKRGASLINHTDVINTHHVSSIIIVDKNLSCGCTRKQEPEDWPLHIQSHNGEWHKVYAEPGDMILYESVACTHGRPDPFKGTFFRNFYVHYKLKDWVYQPE